MQEKLEKFSPVNVMRLHILCEFFLRQQIKFNHCICQRLRVGSQIGYKPEHGPSKSTINLFQRYFTRIININDLKIQKNELYKMFRLYHSLNVRNHVKLGVSLRVLYCVVDTGYGLGRSLRDCRPALLKGQKYQMVEIQVEIHVRRPVV